MAKILIIGKDPDVVGLIHYHLAGQKGYTVYELTPRDSVCFAVLDRMLYTRQPELWFVVIDYPSWNLIIAQHIAKHPNTVAIVLTENNESDVWASLSATHAFVLPAHMWQKVLEKVILAINAAAETILQSTQTPIKPEISCGDLCLDSQRRIVRRGREEIYLTPLEFALLWELVSKAGEVLGYSQLVAQLWPHTAIEKPVEILKGHIRNLRTKLAKGNRRMEYITSITQVGYVFNRQEPQETLQVEQEAMRARA